MAPLIYSAISSLDGYVNDRNGNFDWAAPDEEVHAFVNDLERPIGTYLYGRRMYETMLAWEHPETSSDQRPVMQDYAAMWQAADKVVYSTTLGSVASARTRIDRSFDADAVRHLKAATTRPISVGGPTLAAHAIAAGLVDECHILLKPIVIGGGTRALPDDVRWMLELRDVCRFGDGVVHLHYRELISVTNTRDRVEPLDNVGVHVVAVRLVEHLVPRIGIVDRVHTQPCVAHSLFELANERRAIRRRVGLTGDQQHRQRLRELRDRRRFHLVGRQRQQLRDEAVGHGVVVATELIRDVRVDLRGIAREPVVRRARRSKRLVVRGECPRGRLVGHPRVTRFADHRDERADVVIGARTSRQRETGELVAVLFGIRERDQRPHRVTEHNGGSPGVLVASTLQKLRDVVEQAADAARTGFADTRRRGRSPVAAVIGCVHRASLTGEYLRKPGVPTRVLGHPVRDQHDERGIAAGQPAPVEHLDTVGATERALVHRRTPSERLVSIRSVDHVPPVTRGRSAHTHAP